MKNKRKKTTTIGGKMRDSNSLLRIKGKKILEIGKGKIDGIR